MSGVELTTVESPFIDQLGDMGWKFVTGKAQPASLDEIRVEVSPRCGDRGRS